MKRTHHKIFSLLLVILLGMQACIREEVLLPPVLSPLSDRNLISGSLVTLKGNYFDASAIVVLNDLQVKCEGKPTLTELQFFVPVEEQQKAYSLSVRTEFGSSAVESVVILPPVPVIRKVIPAQAGIGKTILVTGTYFDDKPSVTFKSPGQSNPVPATYTMAGKDTLKVVVPAGLDRDAADIQVISKSGTSERSPFTVLVRPSIGSVSPMKGGAGTIVKIIGKDLAPVETVRFGTIDAAIDTRSEGTIEVRVPDNAVTDTVYIYSGGGDAKSAAKFIVIPKPQITSLDKWEGSVGAEVAITGVNFFDAFEVRFGNTIASIISNTGGVIKSKIPVGAESGKISVITPGGIGKSQDDFIVQGAPLISRFSPLSGLPNTKIILTGLNLASVTKAFIGLKELTILSTADNQLEVVVPSGAVTGKILVTGTIGKFETTGVFTISGTPQITNVTPATGAPGTLVTITGENFPAIPNIKFFNGIESLPGTASSTQIICQVPAVSTTVKINVNGALSPTDFTVIIKPTITSILPIKGGIDREITITGNYLTGAIIKFNNNITAAKVGTDTDTKVMVKVPTGASTGKISVTTVGGTVVSAGDFEVIPAPAITSFSPPSGIAGTAVTINGSNLQYNPIVQFNLTTATVKSVSSSQLVVEVPAGASTGKITVRTDAIALPISSATNFTVIGKPLIANISPNAGTIRERVVITGSNLDNPLSVNFDGVETSDFISKSSTSIEVRVPTTVASGATRSINVNVKTSADISGNTTFTLLGTPTITRLSPDDNPTNWAFLIEGTNLGSVKKLSLGDKVPDIGTRGIDKQAFNYITTKVPRDVAPAVDRKLRLYYTSDDIGFIEMNYEVLSAPPPGVFPPATIILPPPIPSSYVQTDLSNYWIDENYVSTNGERKSCYQLRASFSGQPADDFCIIGKFLAEKNSTRWDVVQGSDQSGSGSWNHGVVSLSFFPDTYTGQVLDQAASKLILQDQNGRQLILVMDNTGACLEAFQVTGICE